MRRKINVFLKINKIKDILIKKLDSVRFEKSYKKDNSSCKEKYRRYAKDINCDCK